MGKRKESQIETIRIGDWMIQPKSQTGRWKVTGREGNFTLHQIDLTTWRYISGQSSNRSQERRQVDACGVEEAALKSIERLFGTVATTVDPKLDIVDVLRHGWEDSDSEPYHKENLKRFTKYFFEWCLGEEIYIWQDLIARKRPSDFVKSLLDRNIQRKSIGHYLEPLKRASKWAANKSRGRIEDWFAGFRLPPKAGVELKYDNKNALAYLSISQILDLLEWLRSYPQGLSLRPGVALQGLCGLQLQEATRLTWDRVDFKLRTITIEEDRRRDPKTAGVKNAWRVRKLPLPSLVYSILLETYHLQGCPSGSSLVIDAPNWKAYSSRFTHMFKAWDPKLRIPPSDFRNTLPNRAEEGKWMSVWVRRYFGHAPATEIERSYLAIQCGQGFKERKDEFVEKLRVEVVRHIEEEISVCLANRKSSKFIQLDDRVA